jgi:DNA-binding Lrp family transcriptional regulator
VQKLALDRIDLRLLAVLQEHGRMSNLELAQTIKLSPAQTLRRHRRLEEMGVIRRYETRLDAESLGFGVVAFIQVTMERGHVSDLLRFKEFVEKLAQIQECFSVTGDIDYVLKVVARDLKA